MTLKNYYDDNKETVKPEYQNEHDALIIFDYLSSFECSVEDIEFIHDLGYTARDFIDFGFEDFYINNDLFLLIDNFYDVFGYLFTSKVRNYTKEDLQDKRDMLQRAVDELNGILSNYAD